MRRARAAPATLSTTSRRPRATRIGLCESRPDRIGIRYIRHDTDGAVADLAHRLVKTWLSPGQHGHVRPLGREQLRYGLAHSG